MDKKDIARIKVQVLQELLEETQKRSDEEVKTLERKLLEFKDASERDLTRDIKKEHYTAHLGKSAGMATINNIIFGKLIEAERELY